MSLTFVSVQFKEKTCKMLHQPWWCEARPCKNCHSNTTDRETEEGINIKLRQNDDTSLFFPTFSFFFQSSKKYCSALSRSQAKVPIIGLNKTKSKVFSSERLYEFCIKKMSKEILGPNKKFYQKKIFKKKFGSKKFCSEKKFSLKKCLSKKISDLEKKLGFKKKFEKREI